jgi:hypothetical protein
MQSRPRKRVGRDEMLLLHSRSLRLVCARKRYEGPAIHARADWDTPTPLHVPTTHRSPIRMRIEHTTDEQQSADVFQHASPEGYSHNQHAPARESPS